MLVPLMPTRWLAVLCIFLRTITSAVSLVLSGFAFGAAALG